MAVTNPNPNPVEFETCSRNASPKATQEQIKNNLAKAKEVATKTWGIYGLENGRFSGSGYGWNVNGNRIVTGDNICVKGAWSTPSPPPPTPATEPVTEPATEPSTEPATEPATEPGINCHFIRLKSFHIA